MAGKSRERRHLKVAIVHDWLIGGGAERVVHELHRMFPDAPIYTSYCSDEWRERLDNQVKTGFLQRQPFPMLRKFVGVLRIWWFSRLDFTGYDLVISSSGNGEAFGVHVPKGTTHISYCHTPTHYYWRHYNQYISQPGFGIFNPIARLGLRLLVSPLRRWDYKAAQRPDYFIANSTHIQHDIKRYYGRESEVIFPPVDTERFSKTPINQPRTGFVTMGRLAPAKHVDIIVAACTKLNLPLTVIGDGPDLTRLKKLAGPNVTFMNKADGTFVPDGDMPAKLASAQAFIFASFDDFGISPVEALTTGTPVIAYKAGGALDYIHEGKTGEFFAEQTVESLCKALSRFDPKAYDHAYIRKQAATFSPKNFVTKMQNFIDKHVV